jgi:hypothetical protein
MDGEMIGNGVAMLSTVRDGFAGWTKKGGYGCEQHDCEQYGFIVVGIALFHLGTVYSPYVDDSYLTDLLRTYLHLLHA